MMPGFVVFVVAALVSLAMIAAAGVWHALVLRRRHGGGVPLPAFLIRAENASPALRELVARMARSAAKDAMQEWDTVPPAIRKAVCQQVQDTMNEWDTVPPQYRAAIGKQIARMVAEAFAIHDGRRN